MARRMNPKRMNRMRKAVTKRPEQVGLCRFIEFKNIEHQKVNGHFTHHPKFTRLQGLQVEHIFYYLEGKTMKKAMVNKRGAKILKVYDEIPKWAHQQLIDKYTTHKKEEVKDEEFQSDR